LRHLEQLLRLDPRGGNGRLSDLPVVAIGVGSAKQAASLNADATGPIFDASENLDFNDATLTLSFNEPVKPSSVLGSALALYNDQAIEADTVSLNMTGGSSNSSNGRTLVFLFSNTDMNALKFLSREGLCSRTGGGDCYVGLQPTFIDDTSNNTLQPRPLYRTDAVVVDTTRPEVQSVTLDMEQGLIVMTLDEPVDDATTALQGITLHNEATLSSSSASLRLGANASTTDSDSTQTSSVLQASDIQRVKAEVNLCTSLNDCYMSVDSTTAEDGSKAANKVTDVVKQVGSLTADSTAPSLGDFTNALTLAEADSIALELIAETAPALFTGTADTYVVIENRTFKDAANVSVVTTGAAVQVGTFTS